ncbi:hypothetical protein QBC35DRAFT_390262 [Podospora australis]|uniref:HTH APSES-type domain-containing protein n=1 Tax=Podospora australis TaxID=1536484 RepID=A0AAN6WPK0_9PEZI|nr:hypothetical protein QBC35DRAFT_390262 [Podospora australis]
MVSVASLLNPEPSRPRAPLPVARPNPLPPRSPRQRLTYELNSSTQRSQTLSHPGPGRAPLRSAMNHKARVRYEPYEILDAESLREVRKFGIENLGFIKNTSRRIPYNSSKKDFYSKTGRESFEVVFEYSFKVPKDDGNAVFTVMWDYNVGLVRMTPFFKCLDYSKTTPAKMLNSNPGLKEITYSITGGSITAQGYWMPYYCAKAVCATFCHQIAGALIPIFGPDFPSECIPEGAPGYKRMIIDPEIVARARREAAHLYERPTPHLSSFPTPRPSRSASPRTSPGPRSRRMHDPYDYHHRADYDRNMLLSPHSEADADTRYRAANRYTQTHYGGVSSLRAATKSRPVAQPPPRSSGWAAVNTRNPPYYPLYRSTPSQDIASEQGSSHNGRDMDSSAFSTNRWLTAVPRSPTPSRMYDRGPPYLQPVPHYPRAPSPVHILPPIRNLHVQSKRPFDQTNHERPGHPSEDLPSIRLRPELKETQEGKGHSMSPPSRVTSPRKMSNDKPRGAADEDAAMMLIQLKQQQQEQQQQQRQADHLKEDQKEGDDIDSEKESERRSCGTTGSTASSICESNATSIAASVHHKREKSRNMLSESESDEDVVMTARSKRRKTFDRYRG